MKEYKRQHFAYPRSSVRCNWLNPSQHRSHRIKRINSLDLTCCFRKREREREREEFTLSWQVEKDEMTSLDQKTVTTLFKDWEKHCGDKTDHINHSHSQTARGGVGLCSQHRRLKLFLIYCQLKPFSLQSSNCAIRNCSWFIFSLSPSALKRQTVQSPTTKLKGKSAAKRKRNVYIKN